MANSTTNRERLLKAIPRDRQLSVAKAFEKHGIEDDDPLLLLTIEILEGEARHIQAEFKRAQPFLKEIYKEETWHKILTSRLMTWVIGPLVAGGIMFTAIMFARKTEFQALEKIVEDPKSFAVAMTDNAKALRDSRKDVEAIKAVAVLLNIPNAVIGAVDGQVAVQFPNANATVTQGKTKTTILLFKDPDRVTEDLLKLPPE